MPSAENISDEVVENTPVEESVAPIDTDEAHDEADAKAQEIIDKYKDGIPEEAEAKVEETEEEEEDSSDDSEGVEIPKELIRKIQDLDLPDEVYERFSTVEDLEWYVSQQEKKADTKPAKEEKVEKKEEPEQVDDSDDPYGIKAMEQDLAEAKELYEEDSPILKFMERQLMATKNIAERARDEDAFRHEQTRNAHIRELEGLLKNAGVSEIPNEDLPFLLDDIHMLADAAHRRGSQPDVNELVNQLVALRFGKQIESKKEEGLKAKAAKTKKRFLKRPSKTSIKTPEAPVIDYNDEDQVYEAAEAIIEKYKTKSNQ